MCVALDLGTTRWRSLRRVGHEVVGRSVPATFALLDDEPGVRDLLERAGLTFATGDGHLALLGRAVATHSAAFRATPLRLLPGGRVPTDDPPARQVIAALVESLLPAPEVAGEPCGLILPAASRSERPSRDFLANLVALRGYEPLPLFAADALALAALADETYTGLTLCFGAGGVCISLLRNGRTQADASEPRGTDWIDEQLARSFELVAYGRRGEPRLDLESARRQRERLTDPLGRPASELGVAVAAAYTELLSATFSTLARKIARQEIRLPAQPLPVVVAGGATAAGDFRSLLQLVLDETLPFACGSIRLAGQNDEYLIARGGLIHAELEQSTRATAAA